MPRIVWNVDPVLAVGGLEIRYYSLCFILSIVAGYVLLGWQLRRGGADREEAGDFVSYGFLGLLIGARLGHALFYDYEKFSHQPSWVFELAAGGLSSHGAAVGLGVATHWFVKRRAIPFLEGCDRLAFAIPPGAFLFRLGNLLNSEIVGKPTDGSWGLQFPRYDLGADGPFRYPTQLYEMMLAALVFALMLLADRRWGREARPRGALTGIVLVALFSGRILVEFLKEPQGPLSFGVLNRGQLLSIPLVVIGVYILRSSLRHPRPAGWNVGSATPRLLRPQRE